MRMQRKVRSDSIEKVGLRMPAMLVFEQTLFNEQMLWDLRSQAGVSWTVGP